MTLRLYTGSSGQGPISMNNTQTEPLKFEFSQEGGLVEQRIFLRSDDALNESFTDGQIYAKDSTLPDESSWVLFAADVNGSAGEYVLNLPFTIDFGEELPIWIKIDMPSGQEQALKTDIQIITRAVRVAS